MANEWGAAPRRKVNHGSPYRCKGGFSGGVTRGCPFGSLDYMGVSRSRILTHPRPLRGGEGGRQAFSSIVFFAPLLLLLAELFSLAHMVLFVLFRLLGPG